MRLTSALSLPHRLARHALISDMAAALRPFRCADLAGFAHAVLYAAGFTPADIAENWRFAANAVAARRRAFQIKG